MHGRARYIVMMALIFAAMAITMGQVAPPLVIIQAADDGEAVYPTASAEGYARETVAYAAPRQGWLPGLWELLVVVIILLIYIPALVAWGFIFHRAGYSWAMLFVMMVPLVNIVWFLIFAFIKWPIQKQLEAARSQTPPAPPLP